MPIKATNSARKATRKLKGIELRPRSFGLLLLVVVVELVDDVVVEGLESAVEEVEVAVWIAMMAARQTHGDVEA